VSWPTIRPDMSRSGLQALPYVDHITWHPADAPPPLDRDVLVTFKGTRGAYIGAYMGPEHGWIGVDALPLEKIAWWADIPPGPPLGFDAARRASQAPA